MRISRVLLCTRTIRRIRSNLNRRKEAARMMLTVFKVLILLRVNITRREDCRTDNMLSTYYINLKVKAIRHRIRIRIIRLLLRNRRIIRRKSLLRYTNAMRMIRLAITTLANLRRIRSLYARKDRANAAAGPGRLATQLMIKARLSMEATRRRLITKLRTRSM